MNVPPGPHPEFPNVFRPLTIAGTRLRNRIFVPAHTTNFGGNNLPTDRHLAYHRARAAGGAALIVFEGVRVHRSSLGRSQGVNGYERACIPRFRRIAQAVQEEGARLFGQIIHLGRHIDGAYTRTPAWGASPIPWTATAPVPHPMTEEEIARVVVAHAEVACNLLEAGLDGIELQLAHGHLLQQFLSPATNLRDDLYGGSSENRLRFALETLRAVRAAVGPDATLGIRISADEYLPGGLDGEQMCDVVVRLAEAARVDFVNVSHSAYHGSYTLSTQMADMSFPGGSFQHLTRAVGAAVASLAAPPKVLTVCQYRSVAEAEAMLATDGADMVGMARAHIADPAIVAKARAGRAAETVPCIACNQGCADMLARSLAITCLTNPAAGREDRWPVPEHDRTSRRRRVLVVGGGPAGAEAAWVAAARGHEVSLWEASPRLGGEMRWLERMPLRAEALRLLHHHEARLARYEVDVHLQRRATLEDVQRAAPDVVVVATGSRPAAQCFEHGGKGLTLQQALADVDALGQTVLLVDSLGTWAVAAVAEHLADLGRLVTIVAPTGVPAWTISAYSSYALRQRLREKGVRILALHAVVGYDGVCARLGDLSCGHELELAADSVIAPQHGASEDALVTALCAWKRDAGIDMEIRAAGDCVAPRTALEAVFEGHEAARLL